MNKNLYTQTFDKITMSDRCKEKITEAAFCKENENVKKAKHRKIRFVPVAAAAAICITCGTWAAAENGGLDWFKSLFSDGMENTEITEFEEGLIGEMENFSFQSTNENVSFEPVGMIADEQNLYCVIRPVNLQGNEISFINLYSDCLKHDEGMGATSSSYIDEETGNIIIKFSLTDQIFTDGHNVSIFLSNYDHSKHIDNQNKLTVSEIENIWSYCVNPYNTQQPLDLSNFNTVSDYDFYRIDFKVNFGNTNTVVIDNLPEDTSYSISKIVITPLSIAAYNELNYIGSKIEVVMNNGSIANASGNYGSSYGYSSSDSTDATNVSCVESQFDSPINPDDIAEIYIDDNLIYSKP
ncbi:hypothetical protein [Porcipelethomonas sp.]|uniref:hypothetical protein n=1 Tax=Porcipelethomonas sp. TaxID=2981675 RepID=UPI003EF29C48